MSELKKFIPPLIKDIEERFYEHGVEALTDEDVAAILGVLEARTEKLKAIGQIATNPHITPYARLNDIKFLAK